MELIVWGANSHGQLGVGRFSEYEFPTTVDNFPSEPRQIVGGAGHTMIVDASGCLWATGWNNKGQLGTGTTTDTDRFIRVEFNQTIRCLSCGWDTSAVITTDDSLFVWGSNGQNQLGFCSKESKYFTRPTKLQLPSSDTAVDIQFGLRHTVILTKSNQVYILGTLKHFKNVKHRIVVHNLCELLHIVPDHKILQIASGQNHILFLDDRNSMHGIGDNKFLQCSEVNPTEKVVKLSCGWTHNAFLTDSKELFMYGRNNYGQCGNGTKSDVEAPQLCRIHPVEDFQLGAEHGILKSNDEVFTWGWNEHGNCGDGLFENLLKPERIKLSANDEVISIVAGSGFCMVLSKRR